jgi:glutathione synthase/RimK-type ligase-like ATP-grasp enzyme
LGSKTIFARTLINATNGRGIVEFELGDVAPRAPLYTAYVPKKAEYRFHIFDGKVIDIQQKKKARDFDADTRDTRIRNMHNGYVYCRDGVAPPNGSADLACRAVASLGYRYGAVDVIYNEKRNCCYVLEVNSRPGLMGTTVEKYAEALITAHDLDKK